MDDRIVIVFARNEAVLAREDGYVEYWIYPDELGDPYLGNLEFETYLSLDHYRAVLQYNGWLQEFDPIVASQKVIAMYVHHLFVTDDVRTGKLPGNFDGDDIPF